ncbi:MAG TPA: TIGR04076 family protein [Thermoanaerobaculia bacterium]|nr:TIGR04076 family protein [Thermoanaerobaculia bacterium]
MSDQERPGSADDEFSLWDLRVEVVRGERPMVCNHREGDSFEVSGEDLSLPPGQTFSIYALAALLPLLPAKQRDTDANDWMTTDAEVACPDPHCGARFRITRVRRRSFRHSEVTAVPLERGSIER